MPPALSLLNPPLASPHPGVWGRVTELLRTSSSEGTQGCHARPVAVSSSAVPSTPACPAHPCHPWASCPPGHVPGQSCGVMARACGLPGHCPAAVPLLLPRAGVRAPRGTGLWPRALSTVRCPEGWSTLGGRAVWTGVPPLPTLTPQPQTPTAAWHFTRTPAAAWGTPSHPAPEARGSVFPLPSGVAEGRVPDRASFLSPRISEPVGRRGSPRTSWPPALSTSRPHPLG